MHPDSQIKIENFKASMYDYILELGYRSHIYFYGVRAIGWDIAISENGPVIY